MGRVWLSMGPPERGENIWEKTQMWLLRGWRKKAESQESKNLFTCHECTDKHKVFVARLHYSYNLFPPRDMSLRTLIAIVHAHHLPFPMLNVFLPHDPLPTTTPPSFSLRSYASISFTFAALPLCGSNLTPTHSPTNFLASSSPTTRCPIHSTCASLLNTLLSTLYPSCAVTALIPGTLFAEIATPRPVPQMSKARSTSPLRMSSEAAMAMCG